MVQNIRIDDYSYTLPDERIARYPLAHRADSRLLLYQGGEIREQRFYELPELLPTGSILVRNNSKVIHARLLFRRSTGAQVEVFCLEPLEPTSYELSLQSHEACSWQCMLGNAKRWRIGGETLCRELELDHKGKVCLRARRVEQDVVHFSWDNPQYSFASILDAMGILPIPPYLNRDSEESDNKSYQTVYAESEGSVAAPTAGLHFTDEVFDHIRQRGMEVANLTLHVGAGTFRPVKSPTIGEHEMHRELVSVELSLLHRLREHIGHIIAIGTTSVRTLESLYHLACKIQSKPDIQADELSVEQWSPYSTSAGFATAELALDCLTSYMTRHKLERLTFPTAILIAPSYRFRLVSGLITNFHQPHSTLLLLIAAFVGEDWRRIYDYALSEGFRFLSYGDSSLLLPQR